MIQPTIARVDSVVAKPSKARLWLGAKNWSERWSWCDALFMAPPVYGLLNKLYPEKNYLAFMDREFKEATDSLYDADAKLYYRDRRYIPKREKNGEKVFWGRGNGWVFAGIPLLLQTLPKDHPKDRKYKKAARKGWKALKSYVHEDGMLGYVQPVSAAPEQVTQNMTEVYGVGAFLMAGIEMLKMK